MYKNNFNLKSFIKTNKYILLALLVLLIYLSPNIFFPHKARYLIHDNLDSNVVWYKNLAESGKMFASKYEIVPNSLGGIPRGCYHTEYNLLYLFYLWFPALLAYNLNIVLMHLIAFFSMYVFLRRYLFRGKQEGMTVGVSLFFALLPFWPSAGLSVPSQPLLLFAFLNILNKHKVWKNLAILAFIPLYSDLLFSNLFLCFILFTAFVVYSIYTRQVNMYVILAFSLFAIISVAADYRLFLMEFVEKFESHRGGMINTNLFNFKGFLGVSALHFLFGQYHFVSLQFPTVIVFSVFAFFISKNRTRKLKLLALLLLAFCFSAVYIIPNWEPIGEFMQRSVFLNSFQLRFYSLFPFLWSLILGYCVKLLIEDKENRKIPVAIALSIAVLVAFLSLGRKNYYNSLEDPNNSTNVENAFYNSVIDRNSDGFASFEEYYRIPIFKKIKETIVPGPYYIGCIGFDGEVAQYNGFNTVGGYFCYYPGRYNALMNDIVSKELEKTGIPWLGSRCYLVSDDLLRGRKVITSLELDYDKLKDLKTKYIFSDRKIINNRLVNETLFTQGSNLLYVYTIQ